MTDVYETVGAIDRSMADHIETTDGSILVDDGDGDLLVAKPKPADDNGGDDQ